jgi:integrase
MLTALQIKAAAPAAKPYKVADRDGLYLMVLPSGVKSWRYNHLAAGKARTKTYGKWPELSLSDAREAHRLYRVALRAPVGSVARPVPLFRDWAEVWMKHYLTTIKKGKNQLLIPGTLRNHITPVLGSRRLDEIRRVELVDLVKGIYAAGKHETAYRVCQRLGQIFNYAQDCGEIERHPGANLSRVLGPKKVRHHPCVPVSEAGQLLADVAAYPDLITRLGLLLIAHTFVRTNDLRSAPWTEVDPAASVWQVSGARVKMGDDFLVPLSRQVRALLAQLQAITGAGALLLPGADGRRPISENTMLFALYRLGYRGRMTVHGFRALASTVLNESKLWRPDAIERQLDHRERNASRAPYNRAEYLDERAQMMQWWSDWIDQQVAAATHPHQAPRLAA